MTLLKRIKRIIYANILYKTEEIKESKKVSNQLNKALNDIDVTIESTKMKINSSTQDLHKKVNETLNNL